MSLSFLNAGFVQRWDTVFDKYPALPLILLVLLGWSILVAYEGFLKKKAILFIPLLSMVLVGILGTKGEGTFALAGTIFVIFWVLFDTFKGKHRKISLFTFIFVLLWGVLFTWWENTPKNLVKRVKNIDSYSYRKIVKLGRKPVPFIFEELKRAKTPYKKILYIRLLMDVDAPIDESLIFLYLKDKSKSDALSVRCEAAKLLGKKGSCKAILPLLEEAHKNLLFAFAQGKEKLKFDEKFYNVCLSAVEEIEKRCGNSSIPYERCLKEKDPFKACAWGLIASRLGGDQSYDAVQKVFDKVYKNAKIMILDSISSQKSYEALPVLFKALKDPSVMVRKKAIDLLQERHETIVIRQLILALYDPNLDVRSKAYKALVKVSKQNILFNPSADAKTRSAQIKEWLIWWENFVRK